MCAEILLSLFESLNYYFGRFFHWKNISFLFISSVFGYHEQLRLLKFPVYFISFFLTGYIFFQKYYKIKYFSLNKNVDFYRRIISFTKPFKFYNKVANRNGECAKVSNLKVLNFFFHHSVDIYFCTWKYDWNLNKDNFSREFS